MSVTDQPIYDIRVAVRAAGEPTVGRKLYRPGWYELVECRHFPLDVYEQRVIEEHESFDRFEVSAHTQDGECVGGVFFVVRDTAIHGLTTIPMHTYVLPAHRGKLGGRLTREYLRTAIGINADFALITRRLPRGDYHYHYKEL